MKSTGVDTLKEKVKKIEITQRTILWIIIIGFLAIIIFSILFQLWAEANAFSLDRINPKDSIANKNQYEVYKLAAEIRQIRSDTSGSLFWLKLVALFVTVGGAVGGYLLGQERVNKNRLNFEQRKNIDGTFQSIVQELSSKEAVLRATAAVKLGAIIQSFPEEWNVYGDDNSNIKRKNELTQLTKSVLAAALSLEENHKVLKVITIALVPKSKQEPKQGETITDLSYLDFSGAKADDAFWAHTDFSNSDFFEGSLRNTSLRNCRLYKTSFYKADLNKSVLKFADCRDAYFSYAKLEGANFSGANLRGVDFTEAILSEDTNFKGAKVFGLKIKDEDTDLLADFEVDISEQDTDTDPDKHIPQLASLKDFLKKQGLVKS